jgi:hypothetical protein
MNQHATKTMVVVTRTLTALRPLGWAAIALAVALLLPSDGQAAGGFRCPSSGRLISLGASTLEVRNRCREPDEIRSTVEHRTVRERVRKWIGGAFQEVWVERTVEVPIDEWTYDFGANRFMKFLRFENGRLHSVGEGPKGSGETE